MVRKTEKIKTIEELQTGAGSLDEDNGRVWAPRTKTPAWQRPDHPCKDQYLGFITTDPQMGLKTRIDSVVKSIV
jgi:hypothetical protein